VNFLRSVTLRHPKTARRQFIPLAPFALTAGELVLPHAGELVLPTPAPALLGGTIHTVAGDIACLPPSLVAGMAMNGMAPPPVAVGGVADEAGARPLDIEIEPPPLAWRRGAATKG
jgi:hypothetical protein